VGDLLDLRCVGPCGKPVVFIDESLEIRPSSDQIIPSYLQRISDDQQEEFGSWVGDRDIVFRVCDASAKNVRTPWRDILLQKRGPESEFKMEMNVNTPSGFGIVADVVLDSWVAREDDVTQLNESTFVENSTAGLSIVAMTENIQVGFSVERFVQILITLPVGVSDFV